MASAIEEFVRRQIAPSTSTHRFDDAVALFSGAARQPSLVGDFPSFAPHLLDTGHTGYSEAEIASMKRDQANGFYWPARNDMIGWLLQRYFRGTKRVLDIGCGTGYVTERCIEELPDACFYATDTSSQGLQMAERALKDKAFLIHLDAKNLPFRETFDLITTFDVLEHIDDDRAVLAETLRALKPGGGVLHFVPQHPAFYSPADRDSRHFRRYGRTELQSKLEEAGFKVIFSTSFICGLFPLFALSRAKSMLSGKHSHEAEHAQQTWVSSALAKFQTAELALSKKGWRYPFGVSRAVVAIRPQ
ncbi:MAG: class I SAM-dependent methyltransferase [Proteobacteria bacterium]|nr:class I SAM-dependent methyltransferase [Pseudomonadota bacterium]